VPQLIERDVLADPFQAVNVVCASTSPGSSITAINNSHFIGLFTFTFVETATVCAFRKSENTLVSMFLCVVVLFFSFPYI